MGLLRVSGTLNVGQFWPARQSDADTTKLVLQLGPNAFQYQPQPNEPFSVTNVFSGAKVKGSVTKPPIDTHNRITVRLQGIDAPELHYRPAALSRSAAPFERAKFEKVNKDYRQRLAESATVALAQALGGGAATLPVTVETYVDAPNDVFDTYGRFIGDLIVHVGQQDLNLNTWLVEQGWAFPAFYSSMSNTEIQSFLAAAALGRTRGRIWTGYRKKIPDFNPALIFRRCGPVNAVADAGSLTLPKLFRRQTTWWTHKQAGVTAKRFKAQLAASRDELMLTNDFLAHGVHSARTRFLDAFLESDGTFLLRPEDMVFKEKPSTLVNASGKEITAW